MSNGITHDDLKNMRAWAQSRIDARTEPPWAYNQYGKLIETLDIIISGREAKMAGPQELDQHRETSPRLVG